jgi:hypothetical protein
VLSTIVFFSACSSTDEVPSNVIEDADGIKVDLDWTTGGSSKDALTDADLDLQIFKDGTKVLYRETTDFERITFDAALYADGVYIVKVKQYEASKNSNYTVTVNGISVTKPYTFTSNFNFADKGRVVDAIKITKTGKKFEMVPA